MITIDDFQKLEIKIGEILTAERVLETDKLLRLTVDFKEDTPRQIISGIAPYFSDPQTLVGRKCAFATNLEPRTIKGLTSQGMILAVSHEEDGNTAFSLLEAEKKMPAGSRVK